MQSHEILREVFQQCSPKKVASELGLSLSMIYKWSEPPDPTAGSGSTNPLDRLEALTGRHFAEIHIVGGGAKNELLNQFTAEATGRRVVAGPVEATALGNIGMQMLACGAVSSLTEVRQLIARSFPAQIHEPRGYDEWDRAYSRFKHYCDPAGAHAMPNEE